MRVRKALIGAGAAVIVALVAGAIALSTVDLNRHVAFVEAKAKEATGRELKIKGDIGFKLSLFPTVAAHGVSFQNAAWGSRPLLASAKRVEVQIALLPLLVGDVVIRRVALLEPDVLLEVNAKGEKNWAFAPSGPTERTAPEGEEAAGVDVRKIAIHNGALRYRQAKPRLEHRAKIERFELDLARGFDALDFDGKGAVNDVPVELEGSVDNLQQAGEEGATGRIELDATVGGNTLQLSGTVPLAAGALVGFDARFSAKLDDAATLRKMLRRPVPSLPPAKLEGRASLKKDSLLIDDLVAEFGKSRAKGRLQIGIAGAHRAIDVRLDASLIDLGELQVARGAAKGKSARRDGRVFPKDPFPIAALKALDGKAEVQIEKLRLADGHVLEGIGARATFKRGKIKTEEVKLRLDGGALRLNLNADASSGRYLAVSASVEGAKVPLAALTGLMGMTTAPQGAPTNIAVKISGRGDSVRTVLASASGNVRIVVGRGRIKNRAINIGADVTELLTALNPTRAQEEYSEIKCAVLHFPVRKGIATLSNGIGVETTKVKLIGGGTINLRTEGIELGFRPKAASGLGVGAGQLASFAKVEGTLANPRIGLDMAGAVGVAAAAGAAVATGGLTLLGGGLLIDSVPDNPCQVALTGAAAGKKGVVDRALDPLKKLFGN